MFIVQVEEKGVIRQLGETAVIHGNKNAIEFGERNK